MPKQTQNKISQNNEKMEDFSKDIEDVIKLFSHNTNIQLQDYAYLVGRYIGLIKSLNKLKGNEDKEENLEKFTNEQIQLLHYKEIDSMIKNNGPFIRQFSVVNEDPTREEEFILMKEIMRKMFGRWMQEVLEIKHPVFFRLGGTIISNFIIRTRVIRTREKFGGKNITNKLNKIWNDLLDKNFDKEKLVYSFLTKEFFVSVVNESFELKNENISMFEQWITARQSLKWLHAQSLTYLSKKGGLFFDNFVFFLNKNFGTKSRLLCLLGGLDGSEDVLKKYEDIRKLVKIEMSEDDLIKKLQYFYLDLITIEDEEEEIKISYIINVFIQIIAVDKILNEKADKFVKEAWFNHHREGFLLFCDYLMDQKKEYVE
uniref:Uncharacterized protein n=1 Tax=Meloidogyne floridensis TaxID=298350 RepID=A0A915NZZ4_9BILA